MLLKIVSTKLYHVCDTALLEIKGVLYDTRDEFYLNQYGAG